MSAAPHRSRRRALRRAAAVALTAAFGALAGCDRGAPAFNATDVTGADWGRRLSLTDHTGKPRTLEDFRGKAVVLFFGFTHCPDVCPSTLSTLAEARRQLGPLAERVQVLFVTLDPRRDTAANLAKYVPAFDPSFIALRGDEEATKAAAREFKVFHQKNVGASPDNYSIDHTAASFVIDPEGRLRLYVRHDQGAEEIASDLRRLLG